MWIIEAILVYILGVILGNPKILRLSRKRTKKLERFSKVYFPIILIGILIAIPIDPILAKILPIPVPDNLFESLFINGTILFHFLLGYYLSKEVFKCS